MNATTLGLRTSGVIFAVICLGHVLRLFTGTPVTLATFSVPAWCSIVAAVVTGTLAVWLWNLTMPGSKPKQSSPAA